MPHVLIADDSQHIRKMVSRLLQAESGYDLCAEAENGKEAIDLALQCRPDLIILDLSMPEMNGLQAAHELTKLMPKVPIILFTLHEELANHIAVVNMDVDRIVSKSEPSSLMGHVRSLVPTWQFGDVANRVSAFHLRKTDGGVQLDESYALFQASLILPEGRSLRRLRDS